METADHSRDAVLTSGVHPDAGCVNGTPAAPARSFEPSGAIVQLVPLSARLAVASLQ
jgi:hypothetical protein